MADVASMIDGVAFPKKRLTIGVGRASRQIGAGEAELLMVPMERLRSELTMEKRKRTAVEDTGRQLRHENGLLSGKASEFEQAAESERDIAELWRRRCLELECECNALAVREDSATAEMHQALEKANAASMHSIDRGIREAEARNAEVQEESAVHDLLTRMRQLDAQLAIRDREIAVLRGDRNECSAEAKICRDGETLLRSELAELQTNFRDQRTWLHEEAERSGRLLSKNENLVWELAAARDRIEALSIECSEQGSALREEAQCTDSLTSRSANLESELLAARDRQLALELDTTVPCARCNRLGLTNDPTWQPPTPRHAIAREAQLGTPRRDRAPGVLEQLPSPTSPLSASLRCPPGSRRDYPRGANERHWRNRILGVHGDVPGSRHRLPDLAASLD